MAAKKSKNSVRTGRWVLKKISKKLPKMEIDFKHVTRQ